MSGSFFLSTVNSHVYRIQSMFSSILGQIQTHVIQELAGGWLMGTYRSRGPLLRSHGVLQENRQSGVTEYDLGPPRRQRHRWVTQSKTGGAARTGRVPGARGVETEGEREEVDGS